MYSGEQFECLNCLRVGNLNYHGGCEGCGSQAVMSVERIKLLADRVERAEEREERIKLKAELGRLWLKVETENPYVIDAAGFWLARFNHNTHEEAEDAA
jgi:hypothetical protein